MYRYLSESAKIRVAKELADKFEEECLVYFAKSSARLYEDYDEFTADEVMDIVRKIIKGQFVVNEYKIVFHDDEDPEGNDETFIESSNESAMFEAERMYAQYGHLYGNNGYTLYLKNEIIKEKK